MKTRKRLALAVTLALAALAAAPAAHAGTYTIYNCLDPATGAAIGPKAASGWSAFDSHPSETNFYESSDCTLYVTPAEGGTTMTADAANQRYAGVEFIPPAATKIRGFELWRAMDVATTSPFTLRRYHDTTADEWYDARSTTCHIGTL